MKHKMNKDEFLSILDRQRQSGLTIKDFCENKVYPASCFYYWKSKYELSEKAVGRKNYQFMTPGEAKKIRECLADEHNALSEGERAIGWTLYFYGLRGTDIASMQYRLGA